MTGQEARDIADTGFSHIAADAELIEALLAQVSGPATLLIKGSRSAAMENVVNALRTGLGESL